VSLKEIIPCHAGILICSGTVGIYGNIEDILVTLFRIFFIKLLELKRCELRMNGKLSGSVDKVVIFVVGNIAVTETLVAYGDGEALNVNTVLCAVSLGDIGCRVCDDLYFCHDFLHSAAFAA